jgi:hypothetical protein
VPLTPLKASMGPIIQRNNKIIAGIWIKPIIKIIVGEAVVKSGCWLPTVPWSWEGCEGWEGGGKGQNARGGVLRLRM